MSDADIAEHNSKYLMEVEMSGHDENEHVRDTGPMRLMEAEMQTACERYEAKQMSSPLKDILELVELSGAAKEVWNAAIEAAALTYTKFTTENPILVLSKLKELKELKK